jgi:hypothetical protein
MQAPSACLEGGEKEALEEWILLTMEFLNPFGRRIVKFYKKRSIWVS